MTTEACQAEDGSDVPASFFVTHCQREVVKVSPMLTVLLIENEPAHLIALALILRASGYSVLEADSADEAERSCQEYHCNPQNPYSQRCGGVCSGKLHKLHEIPWQCCAKSR